MSTAVVSQHTVACLFNAVPHDDLSPAAHYAREAMSLNQLTVDNDLRCVYPAACSCGAADTAGGEMTAPAFAHPMRVDPETCNECLDWQAERIARFLKFDAGAAKEWHPLAYMTEGGVSYARALVLKYRVIDLCETYYERVGRIMAVRGYEDAREQMGLQHFVPNEPLLDLHLGWGAWFKSQVELSAWTSTRFALVCAAFLFGLLYVCCLRGCK